MEYAWYVIKTANGMFWANSGYSVLFIASTLFLFCVRKKYENIILLPIYTVLTMLLTIYNPIFAKISLNLFFGGESDYVRLFLLVPLFGIIAAAGTIMTWKGERCSHGTVLVLVLAIVVMGMTFFSYGSYKKPENIYKLDQEAVEIADCILQDAGTEEVNILFDTDGRAADEVFDSRDDSLLLSIRQYSARLKFVGNLMDDDQYEELEEKEADEYRSSLKEKKYQYILCKENKMKDDFLSDGMACILETENYSILK